MGTVNSLIAAGTALLIALGGYLQYIMRRSVHPCIEFDIDLFAMSTAPSQVVEIVLRVKNVGPGVGRVSSTQCRVKYRVGTDGTRQGSDAKERHGVEPNFYTELGDAEHVAVEENGAGNGCLPETQTETKWWRAGKKCGRGNKRYANEKRDTEFGPILKHPLVLSRKDGPRFIQPGVTQWYRKPLEFPSGDIHLVHVWAAFYYHIEAGPLIWFLAGLLIQRPNAKVLDYTVRRTFELSSGQDTSISAT